MAWRGTDTALVPRSNAECMTDDGCETTWHALCERVSSVLFCVSISGCTFNGLGCHDGMGGFGLDRRHSWRFIYAPRTDSGDGEFLLIGKTA